MWGCAATAGLISQLLCAGHGIWVITHKALEHLEQPSLSGQFCKVSSG